jgi:transcriptional regulator with XRE-family HTH domain
MTKIEETEQIVSENLVALRKSRGLTQGELAAKFNYSDKSVSKWEHGDSIPDLATLQQLCDFYGVTLDYLTHKPTEENIALYKIEDTKAEKTNNRIICALYIMVVWTMAVIAFSATTVLKMNWQTWMSFVWAIPFTFLILGVYNKKHHHQEWSLAYFITFAWCLLIASYMEIGFDLPESKGWGLGFLFILGIPLTIIAILSSRIKKK